MPLQIKPMLCTLLKEPFDDPNYLFEVKWDGYRLIAYLCWIPNLLLAEFYLRRGRRPGMPAAG